MIRSTQTVFLPLLLLSAGVFAQTGLSVSAGPAASWQISRVSGERYTSNPLLGHAVHAAYDLPLAARWILQPSAGFIRKGGYFPEDYTGPGSGGQSLRIHELDLAVRARYLWALEKFDFSLAAGPYAAFLLSKRIGTGNIVVSDGNDYRPMEFGLNAGPGLYFNREKGSFFVEARYLMGLSPINKNSGNPVSTRRTLQAAVLAAGWQFGGKKDE